MQEAKTVLTVEGLEVDIHTSKGVLAAVRDVSFSVRQGETLCLVGESGCGKSMTSLAIMELLPKAARRRARQLNFLGHDLTSSDRDAMRFRGSKMAMIFQEPMTALNPAFSIGDQLTEHYIHHLGASRGAATDRAVELLEMVGIPASSGRLNQYPHQLSGGLRQRIMIAMALMCGPELLIADEPTTALDVTIQAQILSLLTKLQKELGIAMVLITHDLGVVARVAHKVAVMYAGEVVESGPTQALFSNPRHPYTRGLMDCIPVPGAGQRGEKLSTIRGAVPSLYGPISGCAFRDRCAYASPACASHIPVYSQGEHVWRCVLENGVNA